MLFHVRMDVHLPHDLDHVERSALIDREKHVSQNLQREGRWLHLWRVTGRYSNVSIFDVDSNDDLHELLWSLPLFPYMSIDVTPLARHPSAIS